MNAGTSTDVVSNLNPSTFGNNVTFTTTITNLDGSGGPPTGSVEFFDGATDLGAGSALTANGADTAAATFNTATLSAGDHNIRAVYAPTGDFLGSNKALTQSVDAGTSTGVVSNLNPSTFGNNVTFTATVTNTSGSGGTPSGSVDFFDVTTGTDLTPGGTPLSGGVATFSTATLSVGDHTISVVYTPAGDFLGSSGALTQSVDAGTSTGVVSNLNPSTFGNNVTFTATVTNTSGSGGTPSGSVDFFDVTTGTDLTPGGTPLSGGVATFSTATLSVGDHTISVVYTPAGDFLGSSGSLTQSVFAVTSMMPIGSVPPGNTIELDPPPPTGTGTAVVMYTATVTNDSISGGAPTGFIMFTVQGTAPGSTSTVTVMLTGSGATTSTAGATATYGAADTYTVTAHYIPTGDFLANTDMTLTETVTPFVEIIH